MSLLAGDGRSRISSRTAGPTVLDLTALFGAALSTRAQIDAPRHRWSRRYARLLVASDFTLSLIAAAAAFLIRFGASHDTTRTWQYAVTTVLFPFLFVAAVASSRAYETRFLGSGSDEYRRVFDGAVRLAALAAITAVSVQISPARSYIVISFPLATLLALSGRYVGRRILERLRTRGRCLDRVIVVGRERSVAELVRLVHAEPRNGFRVVGACLDTLAPRDATQVEGVPVYGGTSDVIAAIARTGADTVAITAFSDLDTEAVRRLGWALEGTDVSMLLAPRIADVAGPRINIRPVGGLPLLHVEEPELSGGRRLVKGLLDRSVALVALLLLAPLLVGVGIALRLGSKGPAIFKQQRVGTGGRTFTLWKFRTMRVDAEAMLESLLAQNKHGDAGPLFKMDHDPRITALGRHLRRFSIDELPQLVQVLTGRMSLVGPRPPLPREVETYANAVHRRLLVKPGLTGLWQISGRSDLTWDESVHLDLHYVENWSLALDVAILWRTAAAVLRSTGAY
jgi:exopolysaccharide biosynthesis polyprenyl glycosylphosphotransferase